MRRKKSAEARPVGRAFALVCVCVCVCDIIKVRGGFVSPFCEVPNFFVDKKARRPRGNVKIIYD